jgi:hypothetical protein
LAGFGLGRSRAILRRGLTRFVKGLDRLIAIDNFVAKSVCPSDLIFLFDSVLWTLTIEERTGDQDKSDPFFIND